MLLLRTSQLVSEPIAGTSPATTMAPTTPMSLSRRLSPVSKSPRISLMGIPLNISILVLARTAAESCCAPSPTMLL